MALFARAMMMAERALAHSVCFARAACAGCMMNVVCMQLCACLSIYTWRIFGVKVEKPRRAVIAITHTHTHPNQFEGLRDLIYVRGLVAVGQRGYTRVLRG